MSDYRIHLFDHKGEDNVTLLVRDVVTGKAIGKNRFGSQDWKIRKNSKKLKEIRKIVSTLTINDLVQYKD